MGKRNRHKNNIKLEKSKTKLKQVKTKFLPKGQNVTDVSFKIKPIVLPEQLRKSSGDLLSTRKLNVKELLIRLKHHNATVKSDNCHELRDLITHTPECMNQHLSQILHGVCPLILDRERKVRREGIKVIKEILNKGSASRFEAFYSLISSYLYCSMTHIDRNIQEDSLLLLDCLLEEVQCLIAKNADKLLENFFTLISRIKNDSRLGRTLTENLESQQTSVKWRIEVLTRLEKILTAVHTYTIVCLDMDKPQIRVFDMDNCNFTPLYFDCFGRRLVDFNQSVGFNTTIGNCIDVLMPLLYEAWLEVAPSHAKIIASIGLATNTVLSKESANILSCVMGIYYLLWELAVADHKMTSKFESKAAGRLLKSILRTFPHTTGEEKCLRENLLVCYIFVVSNKKLLDRDKIKAAQVVTKYLNCCFLNRNFVDAENSYILSRLLKHFYVENVTYWKKVDVNIDEFVVNSMRFYEKNANVPKVEIMNMFVIIYDIFNGNSDMEKSLSKMGLNLCQILRRGEIPVKVIDMFLLLAKKNVIPVLNGLRSNLQEILYNACAIKIKGIEHTKMSVIKVLSLFYYVPLFEEHFQMLQVFGEKFPQYADFINYVVKKNNFM